MRTRARGQRRRQRRRHRRMVASWAFPRPRRRGPTRLGELDSTDSGSGRRTDPAEMVGRPATTTRGSEDEGGGAAEADEEWGERE
eukprot:4852414-Pyramimonas_sp.AAC.1